MRLPVVLLAATALTAALPAHAADALKFGPAPSWVVPQTIPSDAKKTDAPVALLLEDEQIAFDPGKTTIYHDGALRIQNSQGLSAAGNIAVVWDPATETVTVNKFHIIRGGKVIDVLASGQTFTTLRRETNLDAATLDGTLTATMQPEDLQEGDIIELATTIERADPVLKADQATFASWGDTHIDSAHALISWPQSMKVTFKEWPGTPQARKSVRDGRDVLELSANNLDPVVPPSGAPLRFKITRFAEATNYQSWDQVSELMLPLFEKASVIPAAGPLHDEVEKIRAASKDPKTRAEQALALVENRVRYVALEMGQGGYVPASAETTWSRRFGDCKGKSALLLGILQSLGIQAEPVLVNVGGGDVIADNLPLLDFNHAIVRAHIGGKSYWLDGTRTGDTDLDGIEVPDFGWVLPLTVNASLVHLVPPPLDKPSDETRLNIDASAGIYSPAPATAETILRGDAAIGFEAGLSSLSDAQQQAFFEHYWTNAFDLLTYKSGTSSYDKAKHELRLSMTGEAKLDWSDGFFHVPESSVGYKPDFDRTAGPLHDAPFAIAYPAYSKVIVSLRLPESMIGGRASGSADVHETLAGVKYDRTSRISGDTVTTETSSQSLAPEISYADALAAKSRLTSLSDQDISIPVSRGYRMSQADLQALAQEQPTSARELVTRGNTFLSSSKYDEAIADFTAALKLDPNNEWAIADRGLAYVWKRQFDAAQKDFDALDKVNSSNVVGLRARGLMAEFQHDCAKAVDYYTQSLSKDPGSTWATGHRAICEAELSRNDAALADSEKVLTDEPTWSELRLMRANIYMREGKHEAVAAEADALVRDNPDSDFAYVAAAKSYAALGQRDKAMKLFDKALAIKPTALIYINREQVRPTSDTAERMADLDAALKLEPGNSDASVLKADALVQQGKYTDALALLDHLPKSSADERWVRTDRARLLYKSGRTTDAEKELTDLETKASTANDFNSLCWAKATSDMMLESALKDCQQALKLSPDSGPYLDSLGMVLLKLGRLDESLDAYSKAIAKGVGANSLMGRAFVYLKKGDRAHADADAAAARKLQPDIDDVFADYALKFDRRPLPQTSNKVLAQGVVLKQ
jgi:tetratricopeptide (TPR) repeat protein